MATKTESKIETLYTLTEVCEILKVSRWTVGRWVDTGKLQAVNINPAKKGKAIMRVKQSTLDKMLGGNTPTDEDTPERSRRRQTVKAKRKRLLTTNNFL